MRIGNKVPQGRTQNGFAIIMALCLAMILVLGAPSLGSAIAPGNPSTDSGSSSSSGSCGSGSGGAAGSDVPGASTPDMEDEDTSNVMKTILREGLMASNRSWLDNSRRALEIGIHAALVTGSVQVAEDDSGTWRLVDEVFPFEGSPERNPRSYACDFQVEVHYTLTPGSSVYVGGAIHRNAGKVQETGRKVFRVQLRTDEVLELEVAPGIGNSARAKVLSREYAGYRTTCGSGGREGACGEYGVQADAGSVDLSWNLGLSSPRSGRAGSKGVLRLFSESPDARLAHPYLLICATQPDSDVDVLREVDWDNAIRQIKGADGLLDVVMNAPRGYCGDDDLFDIELSACLQGTIGLYGAAELVSARSRMGSYPSSPDKSWRRSGQLPCSGRNPAEKGRSSQADLHDSARYSTSLGFSDRHELVWGNWRLGRTGLRGGLWTRGSTDFMLGNCSIVNGSCEGLTFDGFSENTGFLAEACVLGYCWGTGVPLPVFH